MPDAVGNAIDLACNDDRLWFDWNSNRDYRLRAVVPDEFAKLGALPHGMVWRVLVIQINREVRVRTPISHPIDLPIEGADDDYLAQIFKQAAPENVQKVAQAARRNATARDLMRRWPTRKTPFPISTFNKRLTCVGRSGTSRQNVGCCPLSILLICNN